MIVFTDVFQQRTSYGRVAAGSAGWDITDTSEMVSSNHVGNH